MDRTRATSGRSASPSSARSARGFFRGLQKVQSSDRGRLATASLYDFDMSANDAVALTRELLAFDTINPPGGERDCARHAGELLEQWGFRTEYHEYAPGRTSVVARAGGSDGKAPLCLTGHLDTVALGARE